MPAQPKKVRRALLHPKGPDTVTMPMSIDQYRVALMEQRRLETEAIQRRHKLLTQEIQRLKSQDWETIKKARQIAAGMLKHSKFLAAAETMRWCQANLPAPKYGGPEGLEAAALEAAGNYRKTHTRGEHGRFEPVSDEAAA
jgi:hypothetical protein